MLTVLIILLLLFLGALSVVLFLPLRLTIDTPREVYRLQWGPVHAGVFFAEDRVRYRLHFPFWTTEGDVSDLIRTNEHGPATVRSRNARTTRRRPSIRALLRSFRVRRFYLVMDTGDPLWNAWLYPLFHFLRRQGRDVSISFTGRNELELIVSNNLYRLLKAVLLHQPTRPKP